MNDFLPIWENKIKFNNHKNLPNSLRCLIELVQVDVEKPAYF